MIEIEPHIKDKQQELIWALSLQKYTQAQIARMFNTNPVTIMRIIKNKPKDYKVKWIKS
jgi:IS30 family transposase